MTINDRTQRAPHDLRFGDVPPDRPRLGSLEHPNLDRPGARQHPASAAQGAVRAAQRAAPAERSRT